MTEKCKLILLDEVNCEFEDLPPSVRRECSDKLKFFIQAARHTPAFKLGRWDGMIRYFHLNGSTYINLLDQVIPIIASHGIEIEIEDRRKVHQKFEFPIIDNNFIVDNAPNCVWPKGHPHAGENIILRDHQVKALNAFSENLKSLGELSTSSGKTIISACMSLMCEKYGRTVVIVPNRDLVKQTYNDYNLLGLDVGVYFGGEHQTDRQHTICTWQSLESWAKKDKEEGTKTLQDFADGQVCVIVDEVHGAKANSLQKLLSSIFKDVPIRWGISGTIPKEDSTFYGILSVLGPIVESVTAKELMDKKILSDCNINMIQMKDSVEFADYSEEHKYLVTDSYRLDWLSEVIKQISKTGNTVVLYSRIETGEELLSRIPDALLVHGGISSKEREESYKSINDSDNRIVLISSGVGAVGLNLPRIFNLILFEPGKSFVKVIQSIGRGIRKAKDKDHVEIFDISSTCKYSKRHLSSRKKLYDDAGYPYNVQKIDYHTQLSTGNIKVEVIQSKKETKEISE